MAEFVKGELITADKLNEVNSTIGNIGSGQFYNGTRSIGPIYMYSYSYFEVATHAYSGIPINGGASNTVRIDKLEDSNWVTVKTDSFGHSAPDGRRSHYYYIKDIGGDGWYTITVRNRNTAWFNVHSDASIGAYGIAQTNCVKGDYLVCVDHPQSSANYIRGELLTAELLNSGRVGTRRVL